MINYKALVLEDQNRRALDIFNNKLFSKTIASYQLEKVKVFLHRLVESYSREGWKLIKMIILFNYSIIYKLFNNLIII